MSTDRGFGSPNGWAERLGLAINAVVVTALAMACVGLVGIALYFLALGVTSLFSNSDGLGAVLAAVLVAVGVVLVGCGVAGIVLAKRLVGPFAQMFRPGRDALHVSWVAAADFAGSVAALFFRNETLKTAAGDGKQANPGYLAGFILLFVLLATAGLLLTPAWAELRRERRRHSQ